MPLSALQILCVNRQVHDEAFKLFYRRNDFVFSEPVQLQDFMMSIGTERLECLRSITLFCKQYDPADGASVTEAVLCSLRCLRGLQKLHLLLPVEGRVQFRYWRCSESLPGVKMLCSFRRLLDIRYRDLYREDMVEKGIAESKLLRQAKRWLVALRHLDYGLKLAQKGVVVGKLHTEKWEHEENWPALESSDCGVRKGCSCGQAEEIQWESKDVGAEWEPTMRTMYEHAGASDTTQLGAGSPTGSAIQRTSLAKITAKVLIMGG